MYTVITLASMLAACACAQALDPSGGVIAPQGWQPWLQESGKNTGGQSDFVCQSGQVMVGRQHQGDENGQTRYQCATASFNGLSVLPVETEQRWGDWIQESGKDNGGQSEYQCPQSWVILGRRHRGDENGQTSYLCAPLAIREWRVELWSEAWSAPIQESGKDSGGTSSFVCPSGQAMIGRRHSGDENGTTSYQCAAFHWSHSPVRSGGTLQGSPIQESGRNSGGTSSFVCPDKLLMIGRFHQGDENGNTRYWCSDTVFVPYSRHDGSWSSWIQESGKDSGGQSSFVCPFGQAMIGRQHSGDANGNTRYQCARIFMRGSLARFTKSNWGPWFQESGTNAGNNQSGFSCPQDTFMTGRQHQGNANGNTRYQCSAGVVFFQPATLDSVHRLARDKVGDPATRSPQQFANRQNLGATDGYHVHLDIGGEGYHSVSGVTSGFEGAININALTDDSQPPHSPIPRLIHVDSWNTNPPYPFADHIADYMTLQGAPLTSFGVDEFVRVLAPKGSVGLWIFTDSTEQKTNLDNLARKLHSRWEYSCTSGKTPCSNACFDEFFGEAGFPKICIRDHR